MSPFAIVESKKHPYATTSPSTHGHLLPTPLYQPAYSASVIPYYWMLRDNSADVSGTFDLGYDDEREPEMGDWAKTWVQHGANHQALLEGFFRHIKPNDSLCFFYAKQTPLTDDPRRVIVGIGRVRNVAPARAYDMQSSGPFHSIIWDRPIEHSIRPEFTDGFLLPYHQALAFASKHPGYDPARILLFAPEGKQREFSYVSELVTDDTAISVLQGALQVIRTASEDLDGPWSEIEAWIDGELARLWSIRGDYPGLGAVLSAFGVHLGNLVGWELQKHISEGTNLANLLDAVFNTPDDFLPASLAHGLEPTLARTWKSLSPTRRQAHLFLMRLSILKEQAQAALQLDLDFTADPYALVRASRNWDEPITCASVDHAIFSDRTIRESVNAGITPPLSGPLDSRRIKAYCVNVLEQASNEGHSLIPQSELLRRVANAGAVPELTLNADMLSAIHGDWSEVIDVVAVSPDPCGYQLSRLSKCRKVISEAVAARTRTVSKRHVTPSDWPAQDAGGDRPITSEQRGALLEIYQSRFSVLLGPAGSGKTTILSVLCSEASIRDGGVLALAPTGKARVRLQQSLRTDAFTVAQFLLDYDRYNPTTGEYTQSITSGYSGASTVIVDEASMLTEEMLAALFDCTRAAKRIILVGDPNQLPPIGTGRPFYDIARHLRDRSGPGYAELKQRHRQHGSEREDLRLADAFICEAEALEEPVTAKCINAPHFRYESWATDDELEHLVLRVLTEELGLSDDHDQLGFDRSLGSTDRGFFVHACVGDDRWQLLGPNRIGAFGSIRLNRLIHERFRQQKLAFSMMRGRRTPKPTGADRIVYGDKVISNHNRQKFMFPIGRGLVANGETGIVCGPFSRERGKPIPNVLNVTFSSQPGNIYKFPQSEFNDNTNGLPPLDLAYSLTVHKAQGSEYGLVIVIIPEPCNLLSRELLYTAFTRQRDRLVILHQGGIAELRKYQSDTFSELARRLTNLFEPPHVRLFDSVPYEDRLIHLSRRGVPMRSKSEVIIADSLTAHGVDYAYEKVLHFNGDSKLPDFTIERADTGETFFWEHCGMLHDPAYASRWHSKLEWYRQHGIVRSEEGDGPNGTLIVTEDKPNGGISSQEISHIIERLLL